MTINDFLDALKSFSEESVKDLILPTRVQSEKEQPTSRAAEIYKMRLPDSKSAKKKAPYIIHQIISFKDFQEEGEPAKAKVVVRSIFCVYSDDEQEGGLMLLELMDRLRIAMLRQVVIKGRYQLNLKEGPEGLAYPDDTAPYFCGEMVSTWIIPAVEREVRQWL